MHGARFFLGIIGICVLGIIGYRYDQYLLEQNYTINVNTSCDPRAEQCFAADCSPEEDADCDTTPYKKVTIRSVDAPMCLEEHACAEFSCGTRPSCLVTTCSNGALEDGETCVGQPIGAGAPVVGTE